MINKKVPEYKYWGLKPSIDYFKLNRKNINHLYKGEKKILSKVIFEGCSILDIGCAEGGFIKIIKSFIKNFDYTGVDVNQKMISLAKKKNPKYKFFKKKGIKMIYCSINSNKELDLFDLLKKIKKLKIDYLLVEGGKKLTLSFLKLNLFNNFYLIRSDQYSSGIKKNNIYQILKFLKKRKLLKTKFVKTYLGDDKITQY